MIRSGEHELWEARVAWGLVLATRPSALTKLGRELARVGRAYGVAAAQAAAGLAAFGRAYSEHMQRVGERLQAADLGSNWTANRTTAPKTADQQSGGEG